MPTPPAGSVGILGEGKVGSLPASANATATPVLLANLGLGRKQFPDGEYANAYTVNNPDTSSSYIIRVQVSGLHDTNATSVNYGSVYPGSFKTFQLTANNSFASIWAWGVTVDNATTNSAIGISGEIMIRR